MRFVLDENVPAAVGKALQNHKCEVSSIRDHVLTGSPDPVVATAALELNAVLVTFDADFKHRSNGLTQSHRKRFRQLSRILFRLNEWEAARRLSEVMDFVVSEYRLAEKTKKPLILTISKDFLRTER